MANKKISALDSLGGTPAVGDIIPITDVSDTTGSAQGTTKKVTVSNLMSAVVIADENLRGTDNPHIGAFPNQSFLVTDNPSKSVMLASDSDGTLNVITSAGKFPIPVGLSVSEDSAEPDIEITTTSGIYSVVTGDSDALGANGLPIRQGFNLPDIGANPAPLLISGGSIS
tara:strand:+ start:102 stop:611 length:510 start_codon:yes stop_codon:yes gene_type:complete